jgi:hypothetical protein
MTFVEAPDPHEDLDLVVETVGRTPSPERDPDRAGRADDAEPLAALEALHRLRDRLADWEPALIEAARDRGTSWARLAPVLGVSTRQAAERRYLRMRPGADTTLTGEQRVQATRDERAGDRAVATWAREHAGELRQIAGRVSALEGLTGRARRRARTLAGELTGDDAATLVEPLTRMHPDLVTDHAQLADQVADVSSRVVALRRETQRQRDEAARG